jgi:hypothetical protein
MLQPEAAGFPTIAFRIAKWLWTQNSYLITSNGPAKKGNLNLLTDGTFHNFSLITHAFTDDVENLKKRTLLYEDIVKELECKSIKRGKGSFQCELSGRFVYYTNKISFIYNYLNVRII